MAGIISDIFGWYKHLEVDKDKALELIGDDAVILDVRSGKQIKNVEPIFEENFHLEFSEFEKKFNESLEKNLFKKDDLFLVFCKSGSKGLKAVRLLRSIGVENSFNVKYGTNAWFANLDGCGT